MYRAELSPHRSLTRWFPRLLVAGSFALGACNAGDTVAPSAGDTVALSADDQGISAAKGPTGQACIGCPVVSSHILFSTPVGYKNNDIYTMNPDGTGRRVVFTSPMDDYDPAWSPSYTKFVFSRRHGGHMGAIYNGLWTIGWDGLGLFRVTSDSSDKGPAWSKTNRIAFYSTRETQTTNEIYTINPDGTGLTRLTNNAVEDRNPAWSPDGSKIVFASNRGRTLGAMHLYVMNTDGTGVKQLTFGATSEDQPAWSPDGSQIAYHLSGGAQPGLWAMNPDGTNARALSIGLEPGPNGKQEVFLGQPSWSPDSKKIAYTADWIGFHQIYTLSADGIGGGFRPTPLDQQDQEPAWSY